MLQLLNFLRKYRVATLFVLLEFIALTFITRSHSYHHAKYLNSANAISGSIHNKTNSISNYFLLKTKNDALVKENELLKNNLEQYKKKENLGGLVTIDTVQFSYISAKVISNSHSKRNNILTLNKGAADGVKPNMGVILSDGIIGITLNVSKHYTTVLSVLNNQAKFNVKLKKSHHYGSLEWNGNYFTELSMVDFPIQANIKVGDSVISGGKSVLFPEGIPVGIVTDLLVENNSYQYIKLKPFIDFSALHEVYIIKNSLAKERTTLENKHE